MFFIVHLSVTLIFMDEFRISLNPASLQFNHTCKLPAVSAMVLLQWQIAFWWLVPTYALQRTDVYRAAWMHHFRMMYLWKPVDNIVPYCKRTGSAPARAQNVINLVLAHRSGSKDQRVFPLVPSTSLRVNVSCAQR